MEIKIDTNGIERYVKPAIKLAKNDLKSAKSAASSISVPSDFKQSAQLKSIPKEIATIETELGSMSTLMDSIISKFQGAESKNTSVINQLMSTLKFGDIGEIATGSMQSKIEFAELEKVAGIGEVAVEGIETAEITGTGENTTLKVANILSACEEVTQTFLERDTHYTTDLNKLISGDIAKCYEQSGIDGKTGICCGTYVSMVLYKSGALKEEQINGYLYHWTGDDGIPTMLEDAGWHQVTPAEVQPGDVVNKKEEHVLIYAGNGQCWDQKSCVVWSNGHPPTRSTVTYDLNGCQIWRAPEIELE